MGIFKKIGKGIKKVFSKIGRGIKKAFKAFGKFMGKIGFAGQLALMFLFPAGIGSLLTKGLGKLGTALQAAGAQGGMLSKAFTGVGKILTKAQKFVTTVRSGFSSLTNGIKEFGKTALSKVGIKLDGAAANFFGPDSALEATKAGFADTGKLIGGLKEGTLDLTENTSLKDFSNKVGISQADLKRLNPNLKILKDGMIDLKGAPSLTMNIDLAGDAVSRVQGSIPSEGVGSFAADSANPEYYQREAFDNALSQTESSTNIASGKGFGGKTGGPISQGVQPVATVKPVPTANEIMAQRNQSAFDNMQKQPISLYDEIQIDRMADPKFGTPSTLNADLKDISSLELGGDESYLSRVWDATKDQTLASIDPTKVGALQAVSGAQNLIAPFMQPEEQEPYGMGRGVQDFHTGFTGYTPPNDFNMFEQTNNQFGSPALREQLTLYKIYSPFEDTMFNMRQGSTS